MKHNDLTDVSLKLTSQNYENIFNVNVDENGQYYYDLLKVINFPDDMDQSVYSTYVVEFGDIWPTIAWKYYRNVKLWWIICAANSIDDPTQMPIPGTKLRIINNLIVRSILNQIKE